MADIQRSGPNENPFPQSFIRPAGGGGIHRRPGGMQQRDRDVLFIRLVQFRFFFRSVGGVERRQRAAGLCHRYLQPEVQPVLLHAGL